MIIDLFLFAGLVAAMTWFAADDALRRKEKFEMPSPDRALERERNAA